MRQKPRNHRNGYVNASTHDMGMSSLFLVQYPRVDTHSTESTIMKQILHSH